jgi:hypothetical protein
VFLWPSVRCLALLSFPSQVLASHSLLPSPSCRQSFRQSTVHLCPQSTPRRALKWPLASSLWSRASFDTSALLARKTAVFCVLALYCGQPAVSTGKDVACTSRRRAPLRPSCQFLDPLRSHCTTCNCLCTSSTTPASGRGDNCKSLELASCGCAPAPHSSTPKLLRLRKRTPQSHSRDGEQQAHSLEPPTTIIHTQNAFSPADFRHIAIGLDSPLNDSSGSAPKPGLPSHQNLEPRTSNLTPSYETQRHDDTL